MKIGADGIGPLLATGREAEVFEYGAGVLKLYRAGIPKRSAFREAAALVTVTLTLAVVL